jgi:hypothetical protein
MGSKYLSHYMKILNSENMSVKVRGYHVYKLKGSNSINSARFINNL